MTTVPGTSRRSDTSSQWPACEPPSFRSSCSRAADRADREVEVAVVVEVRRREATPVPRRNGADVERPDVPAVGREDAHRLCVLREARDRNRTVRHRELGGAVVVEIGPGDAPPGERPAQRADEIRASVGERLSRPAPVDGVELAARVRHEQVLAPVAGEVACGDSHPGVRVVERQLPAVLDEPEAEPVLRGQVEVEPVGVEVVRHEQVGSAVAVHVGEGRAEPMVEPVWLEPGRASRPLGIAGARRARRR